MDHHQVLIKKITDQDGNTDSNLNATTNGYTPQLCMGGLKYYTSTGSLWHGKICEVITLFINNSKCCIDNTRKR